MVFVNTNVSSGDTFGRNYISQMNLLESQNYSLVALLCLASGQTQDLQLQMETDDDTQTEITNDNISYDKATL